MKKYTLKDGSLTKRGTVKVDEKGNWEYEGDDGGRNSGTSKGLLGGKRAFYSKEGRVAVRNRDGSCVYDETDPKTKKKTSTVGSLD